MPWAGQGNKPEDIKVRVTILKDESNEGQYYVEFKNMRGANFAFTKIYKDIKEKGLNFAYESSGYVVVEGK